MTTQMKRLAIVLPATVCIALGRLVLATLVVLALLPHLAILVWRGLEVPKEPCLEDSSTDLKEFLHESVARFDLQTASDR